MQKSAVDLNAHRGAASPQVSDVLRQLCSTDDEQRALKSRQEELESQLLELPSQTVAQAFDRARYLIGLLAQTSMGRDPRRRKLIANTLEDIRRLASGPANQRT